MPPPPLGEGWGGGRELRTTPSPHPSLPPAGEGADRGCTTQGLCLRLGLHGQRLAVHRAPEAAVDPVFERDDPTGARGIAEQADSGAVTQIQPILGLGSAANLNIHLNRLVLDGVYRRTDGEPAFVEVPAPTAPSRGRL